MFGGSVLGENPLFPRATTATSVRLNTKIDIKQGASCINIPFGGLRIHTLKRGGVRVCVCVCVCRCAKVFISVCRLVVMHGSLYAVQQKLLGANVHKHVNVFLLA